jgi:hypothetical protein
LAQAPQPLMASRPHPAGLKARIREDHHEPSHQTEHPEAERQADEVSGYLRRAMRFGSSSRGWKFCARTCGRPDRFCTGDNGRLRNRNRGEKRNDDWMMTAAAFRSAARTIFRRGDGHAAGRAGEADHGHALIWGEKQSHHPYLNERLFAWWRVVLRYEEVSPGYQGDDAAEDDANVQRCTKSCQYCSPSAIFFLPRFRGGQGMTAGAISAEKTEKGAEVGVFPYGSVTTPPA